jgi:hypothetical protein
MFLAPYLPPSAMLNSEAPTRKSKYSPWPYVVWIRSTLVCDKKGGLVRRPPLRGFALDS